MWLNFQGHGTADCILAAKFKHLKNKLIEWRATKYPKEVEDLKMLKTKVHSLDSIVETMMLFEPQRAEKEGWHQKNNRA